MVFYKFSEFQDEKQLLTELKVFYPEYKISQESTGYIASIQKA